MTSSAALSLLGPLVIGSYVAFGMYGIRLESRLDQLKVEVPPKDDRWNPRYYRAGAEPLLRRNRRWERLKIPIWLGLIALANVIYWLLT